MTNGSCNLADIRLCRVQLFRHVSDFHCKLADIVGSSYPTSEIRPDTAFSMLDVGCVTANHPTLLDASHPTRQNPPQIARHVGSSHPTSGACRLQPIRHPVGCKKSDILSATICPTPIFHNALYNGKAGSTNPTSTTVRV